MNYLIETKQSNLTLQEYKLYARHLILPQVQVQGQKRLKKARILCIGAGALNAISLLYLAASGIGQIGIVDHDKVELSNLHRQIIYNYNDIGNSKVLSAQHTLTNLNKQCKVYTYNIAISYNNALQIIQPYDIIIDGTDNFNTKRIISYSCQSLHKIHIYGAVYGFEGQTTVFNYQSGPNYQDLYPFIYSKRCQPCNNGGILGITPGVIGMIQATEAVKIILGLGEVLNSTMLMYNVMNMSFNKTLFTRNYNKRESVNYKEIKNIQNPYKKYINTLALHRIVNKRSIQLYVIDIRSPNEYNLYHIQGAVNIPTYKLTYMKNINQLKRYIKNKHLIIYCSNDQKTLIISEILKKEKINHWILYNYINPF